MAKGADGVTPTAPSAGSGSVRASALTRLEAALRLVDHVDAALAAHDAAIAMALLERAERVSDLHRSSPDRGARCALGCAPLEGNRWWAVLGSNQ